MIKYVKRESIDIKKYNICIGQSKNTRIYAFSWYLDLVADNWDALILDDYKAVMPLPWRSKYFIKYIYTPCWAQQLGVFSSCKISEELIHKFIEKIPKKFKKITINFNTDNQILGKNTLERANYILPLNKPYQELFREYKYVRRRGKKLLDKSKIVITNTSNYKEIISLFKSQKQLEVNLKISDYDKLESLLAFLKQLKKVDIIVAKNPKKELLGGAFFIKDNKRITYLFSSISQEGRNEQVMTYVIDNLIEKYANSNLILDFEGSMIPGIAFFFRSFGAKKEFYYHWSKKTIGYN